MEKYKRKAFTLVELIIVITILAILATIGFISYQSYTSDARDTNRTTTLKEASNGLDIYYTKKSFYPDPDSPISTWSINSIIYAYRWLLGSKTLWFIKMSDNKDPISQDYYSYAVDSSKTKYELGAVMENTLAINDSLVNTTYAQAGYVAKVSWNYNWIMKFSSWTQIWIANIPSLLWNNTWSVSLLSNGTQYVVDWSTNLPYKLNSGTDLWSKDATTIIKEVTGNSTASLTWVNITNITSQSSLTTLFTWALLASFWGNISTVSSNVLWTVVISWTTPAPAVLWTITNPGTSCKTILDSWSSIGNGIYYIKPDSNPAFQSYCDMSWGGRTLVAWINSLNQNHLNSWSVTPTNITSITWFWKFSDNMINLIQWAGSNELKLNCWTYIMTGIVNCTFNAAVDIWTAANNCYNPWTLYREGWYRWPAFHTNTNLWYYWVSTANWCSSYDPYITQQSGTLWAR